MTVPTYDQFIEPLLRYLAKHPEGVPTKEAQDACADFFDLSESDRAERLPSGVQAVYRNRVGWGHDRLKRAGYSHSPRRGFWQLTELGHAFAQQHDALTKDQLRALWSMKVHHLQADNIVVGTSPDDAAALTESPEERLDSAVTELKDSVQAELLESIMQNSPGFFERLVLDVLHAMGYGTSRKDIEQVGKTNDGGIDGVISLDRLGLEKVYVQAKRWQNNVGRPEVQGFYGALAGQRARKGVFITTSSFSQQAIDFANSVEGVILLDGQRLAQLMIDFEVGISPRLVRVPKLDLDYFEE